MTESAVPLRPIRRVNPLGAFSIAIGVLTTAISIWLLGVVPDTPNDGGGNLIAGLSLGLTIGFVLVEFAVIAVLALVGSLAAIFGLIRAPRWQGGVGLLLNLVVPIVVLLIRLG